MIRCKCECDAADACLVDRKGKLRLIVEVAIAIEANLIASHWLYAWLCGYIGDCDRSAELARNVGD